MKSLHVFTKIIVMTRIISVTEIENIQVKDQLATLTFINITIYICL